jgi:hypothetical protein
LLNARVEFSQISGAANPFPSATACTIPRTMSDYSVRAIVGGIGRAIRGPIPVGNTIPCDSIRTAGDQCYVATGSQLVTVAPVPADLDFAGTYNGIRSQSIYVPRFVNDSSGATLVGYTPVLFTDSTFPRSVPLRNLNHTWTFADPSDLGDTYWHKTQNECYAGLLSCNVNIKETGVMTSLTRVNGLQHTDTVTIYCVDSMPIFNNDKVRQGLMAAIDSSGAGIDSVGKFSRKERGYLILQDTVTPGAKPYIHLFPVKPHADACQYGGKYPEFSDRPANTKVLGWGHTHPAIGSVLLCRDTLGNYRYDAQGQPIASEVVSGISDPDWDENHRRNDPTYPDYVGAVNDFVMQSDGSILILRPTQLAGAALKLAANHFKWSKSRCAWPRRTI